MKKGIHFGASGRIFGNAKSLRKNMTYAEKLLWSRIRDNKIGYYFRRQHPLSNYVVDFFCHQVSLVIEVDGDVHADKTVQLEDKDKEESIKSYGLHMIRFTNDEVIKDVNGIVRMIKSEAQRIEENLFGT